MNTSTTRTTNTQRPFTIADIEAARKLIEAARKLIEAIPECHIAALMRANGFDPDKGAIAILPAHMKPLQRLWPEYVRFSAFVEGAMYFMADPRVGLREPPRITF